MSVNALDEYWMPEHVREYLHRFGFVHSLDDMEPWIRSWDDWMSARGMGGGHAASWAQKSLHVGSLFAPSFIFPELVMRQLLLEASDDLCWINAIRTNLHTDLVSYGQALVRFHLFHESLQLIVTAESASISLDVIFNRGVPALQVALGGVSGNNEASIDKEVIVLFVEGS